MVVVDFGCGPGILTQEYARLTGPAGRVYGVEQNREVTAVIGAHDANVHFVFQDYDLALNLVHLPDIIFLTDTPHHLTDPLRVLQRIKAACGAKTTVFIAEYDPEMPGRVGAKLQRRMPKEHLSNMLLTGGFAHDEIFDSEDEHYAVIARCSSG